jgi:hypothetical protein
MDVLPLILIIAIFIVVVGSLWRIFDKAGRAGVLSIIPIVNTIVLLRIAGKPWWWFFLLLIPVVNFIVLIVVTFSLAKAFGQSDGFGCLLLLFPFIFFPVLGWGSARYQGAP